MTSAEVVETSVTVKNSPIQDFVHPNDKAQPTYEMTAGFKPFTAKIICCPQKRVKTIRPNNGFTSLRFVRTGNY